MTNQLLLTRSKWNALQSARGGRALISSQRRSHVFKLAWKNELYWFEEGDKSKSRESFEPRLDHDLKMRWQMNGGMRKNTLKSNWVWIVVAWIYRCGVPQTWKSYIDAVQMGRQRGDCCCCYDSFTAHVTPGQYKWLVIVFPQQALLIEYTQAEVKGCDKSASVERLAHRGKRISTLHKHCSETDLSADSRWGQPVFTEVPALV